MAFHSCHHVLGEKKEKESTSSKSVSAIKRRALRNPGALGQPRHTSPSAPSRPIAWALHSLTPDPRCLGASTLHLYTYLDVPTGYLRPESCMRPAEPQIHRLQRPTESHPCMRGQPGHTISQVATQQ